jgi:GNAT superfamily N-acetyltransferase
MEKAEVDIEIRKAKADDAKEIEPLYLELMNLHAAKLPNIFMSETKVDLDEIESDIYEFDYFYVVTCDNKVIGYMKGRYKNIEESLFVKERNMIMLTDLIIKEEYRNHGIGKRMLDFIEEEAKIKNISSIEIPVYNFNEQAKSFYIKNGYNSYLKRELKVVDKAK